MPPKKNLQQLMAERHEVFLEMMTAFHQDLRNVVTTTVETAMQTALQVGNQGRVQHEADHVQHEADRVQHAAERVQHRANRVQHQNRVQHRANRVQHQFEEQNLEDLHQGDDGAAFQNRVEVRQPRGEIAVHRGDYQPWESSFRLDLPELSGPGAPDDQVLDGVAELFSEDLPDDEVLNGVAELFAEDLPDDEVLDGVAELFAEEQVEGDTGHMLQKNKPPDPPDFSRFGHVRTMTKQSLQEEEMIQDKEYCPDQVLCQTKAPPCLQPEVLISYSELVRNGREKSYDKAELDEYGTGVGVGTLFFHVQDTIVLHQISSNGISYCVNQLCDAMLRSHGYRLTTKCSKSWRFKFKYSLKNDQLYYTVDYKYKKLQIWIDLKELKIFKGNRSNRSFHFEKKQENEHEQRELREWLRVEIWRILKGGYVRVEGKVSLENVKPLSCLLLEVFFGDPRWSFSSMILTIPMIWQLFPNLKVVFANPSLSQHCIQKGTFVLPMETTPDFPGYACLLGNMLDSANVVLSLPECPLDVAIDIASVATFLLATLPPLQLSERESRQSSSDEDDMLIDEVPELVLNKTVEQQITNAINSRFLLQLTTTLFHQVSLGSQPYDEDKEVFAIGTACSFLYVAFNTLPLEQIMTVLAYRTELVAVLWDYMKRCHENQKWSSLPNLLACLPGDAPGWLLPLVVFCPVYKHMLVIVDNEEFYEREEPLSLQDIRLLIIILKQILWQLLWVNPLKQPNNGKSVSKNLSKKKPVDLIQNRVEVVVSEILSKLQDWNNRQQFTLSSDFQADSVNEYFISQAIMEGTRANYILMHTLFLIPFTSRVKIFTTQLATERENPGSQGIFARSRFRIRRDHILEDAYNQMSALSENDLRGSIRVTIVNELGVEEAGIDGGGIFKDLKEFPSINRRYGFWTDGGNKKKLMNIQDDPKKKKMGLMRVNEKMTKTNSCQAHEPHYTIEVKSVMQELNWSGAKKDAHVLENCQGNSLWVFVKRHEVIVEAVMTLYKKVTFDHYLRHLEKNYTVSIIRTEDVFTVTTVTTFTVIQSNGYLVSILFYGVFHSPRPPEVCESSLWEHLLKVKSAYVAIVVIPYIDDCLGRASCILATDNRYGSQTDRYMELHWTLFYEVFHPSRPPELRI